jgi:hypothetical protein
MVMAYHPVTIKAVNIDTGIAQYTTVQGETVSGLYVHPDRIGRGWVVSTKANLAVYGAPAHNSMELHSRHEARRVAKFLAHFMPDEVKSGEWNGKRWTAEDPSGAELFHAAIRDLNISLSGF